MDNNRISNKPAKIKGHIILSENAREGRVIQIKTEDSSIENSLRGKIRSLESILHFDPRKYSTGKKGFMHLKIDSEHFIAYVESTLVQNRPDSHIHIIVMDSDDYSDINYDLMYLYENNFFVPFNHLTSKISMNSFRYEIPQYIQLPKTNRSEGKSLINSWINGNKIIYTQNELAPSIIKKISPIIGNFNFCINIAPVEVQRFDLCILEGHNQNMRNYSTSKLTEYLMTADNPEAYLSILPSNYDNLKLISTFFERLGDPAVTITKIVKDQLIDYTKAYEAFSSDLVKLLYVFNHFLAVKQIDVKKLSQESTLKDILIQIRKKVTSKELIQKYKYINTIFEDFYRTSNRPQVYSDAKILSYNELVRRHVYKNKLISEKALINLIIENDDLLANNPKLLSKSIISNVGSKKSLIHLLNWISKTSYETMVQEVELGFDYSEVFNAYFEVDVLTEILDNDILLKRRLNHVFKFITRGEHVISKALKLLFVVENSKKLSPLTINLLIKSISLGIITNINRGRLSINDLYEEHKIGILSMNVMDSIVILAERTNSDLLEKANKRFLEAFR